MGWLSSHYQETVSKVWNQVKGLLRQVNEPVANGFDVMSREATAKMPRFRYLESRGAEHVARFAQAVFPEVGTPLIYGILIIRWDKAIAVRSSDQKFEDVPNACDVRRGYQEMSPRHEYAMRFSK